MTIFHVIKYPISNPIKLLEIQKIPHSVKQKTYLKWVNELCPDHHKHGIFSDPRYRKELIKNLLEYEEPE